MNSNYCTRHHQVAHRFAILPLLLFLSAEFALNIGECRGHTPAVDGRPLGTDAEGREMFRVVQDAPSKPRPLTKADCESVAKRIRAGMSRANVERVLKAYRPIPIYGGGQGGPQMTHYMLNAHWQLVVWFDLVRHGNDPIESADHSPTDRVSTEPIRVSKVFIR